MSAPQFKPEIRWQRLCAVTILSVVLSPALLFAQGQATLQPVPPIGNEALASVPKNVARWHMGASLTLSDGQSIHRQSAKRYAEGALLADDDTLSYELGTGRTEFIIELGDFHQLSRMGFMSQGAAGSVSIYTSPVKLESGSSQWQQAANGQAFDESQPLSVDFAETDAKFVKLVFDITKPGSVGSLLLEGATSVADTAFASDLYDITEAQSLTDDQRSDFDFAALHAGARVAFISGGNPGDALAMIDDDPTTNFEFSGSEGLVVIDLNRNAWIEDISVLSSGGAGTLEVYTFAALPGQVDPTSGELLLPPTFFQDTPPTGVSSPESTDGRLQVKIPGSEARFVMLRWQGSGAPPSFSEISVVGPVPADRRFIAYAPTFEFAAPPDTSRVPAPPSPTSIAPRIPPASP
jgi:hypothetical protein